MSWGDKIRKVAQKRGVSTEKMVKAVFIQGCNTAIKAAPVGNGDLWKLPPPADYVGGSYRASLRATINKIDYTITGSTDYSGVFIEASSEAAKMKLGDVIYFTSPLPYGPRLEYDAWSSQAPNGIFRPAVKAIKSAIDKELKK
jgi:hypothetical protein